MGIYTTKLTINSLIALKQELGRISTVGICMEKQYLL